MTDREKLIEMLIESGNIGRRRNRKCIYELVKDQDRSNSEPYDSLSFAAIAALYFLIAEAERVLKEREQCSTKD